MVRRSDNEAGTQQISRFVTSEFGMNGFALSRRALAALLLAPVATNAQPALGLAERRALAAYQADIWPGLLAEIRTAAGFDLAVDVNWESLALPGQASNYASPDFWTDIIFKPLARALTSITRDEMGRTALRAKLTRVVVMFNDATSPLSNYPNGLRFENGVLTINFRPRANAQDGAARTAAITAILERNL